MVLKSSFAKAEFLSSNLDSNNELPYDQTWSGKGTIGALKAYKAKERAKYNT